MEKPDIVLTDFETGNISLANGTDLNNIFNFTINFDLLKDVLTTLIKNQINLKYQLDEKYKVQTQIVESLKNEITDVKQSELKETFKVTKEDFEKVNNRIKNLEHKITKINEERVKEVDAEAMWMLGACNEFGIGTEQDIERTEELYKQSYERENRIGEILMENKRYERGSGYLKIARL